MSAPKGKWQTAHFAFPDDEEKRATLGILNFLAHKKDGDSALAIATAVSAPQIFATWIDKEEISREVRNPFQVTGKNKVMEYIAQLKEAGLIDVKKGAEKGGYQITAPRNFISERGEICLAKLKEEWQRGQASSRQAGSDRGPT